MTWGKTQCKLQALPMSKFCGNHKDKQPYGLALEDKEIKEEGKEEVQEEVQEVVQEAMVPQVYSPEVEIFTGGLDVDIFSLPIPRRLCSPSAFSGHQQHEPS